VEIVWAAGLFEGEGSCGKRLQLKMVEEESVRRFGAVIGVGKVYGPYGPYASQLGTRPFFMWTAWKREDSVAAAKALIPHVSPWLRVKLEAVL
jgi:hypothetical protein